MGAEANLETFFVKYAKSQGQWAIKLGFIKGIPDRLLIGYMKVVFVELKTPKGKLSAAQRLIHRRLAKLGFIVRVPRTRQELRDIVDENSA